MKEISHILTQGRQKKIERKKGKTIIVDDSAHPWTYVRGHGDLKIDYRFN